MNRCLVVKKSILIDIIYSGACVPIEIECISFEFETQFFLMFGVGFSQTRYGHVGIKD